MTPRALILAACKATGLSQNKLAQRIGVCRRSIRYYAADKQEPSPATRKKLEGLIKNNKKGKRS